MTNKEPVTGIIDEVLDVTETGVEFTAETIEKFHKAIEDKIRKRRDTYAKKYPTSTTIIAIFGIILTYYGIEKFIDSSPVLSNHPIIVMLVGIFLLIVTGRLISQSYAS